MSETKIHPALKTMANASRAELIRMKAHHKHVTLSLWNNSQDQVLFHNEKFHTLSLYYEGGENNHRTDKAINNRSGENKICLMPAKSKSEWDIGAPFKLAHLYFTDEYLKQTALETYDIDPRIIDLNELNFENDQQLAGLMRFGIYENDWLDPMNQTFIDQGVQMIMQKLLQKYSGRELSAPMVKGGLSRPHQVMIEGYIRENLDQNLMLLELSQLVGLSEYHFARMFKLSFALSPHQYIQKLRVEKAGDLLKSKMSLIDIAAHCGFASQSHLGRIFKAHKGITPLKFRKNFK